MYETDKRFKSYTFFNIKARTNFMKECLWSRTPRSQFITTDGSNQVTRKFQIRVTPVNFL